MDEQETMVNSAGHHVPIELVKEHDLLRDEIVMQIVAQAEEMNRALAAFKERIMGDVIAFRQLLAEKYGVTIKEDAKGNISLTSYDGRHQVAIQMQDYIDYGPELDVAKQLVDACVNEWSAGADPKLRAMVSHAFQTDKKGRINRTALLQLRQLKVDDAGWQTAMQAIADAQHVTATVPYLSINRRDPKTRRTTAIPLNLARV